MTRVLACRQSHNYWLSSAGLEKYLNLVIQIQMQGSECSNVCKLEHQLKQIWSTLTAAHSIKITFSLLNKNKLSTNSHWFNIKMYFFYIIRIAGWCIISKPAFGHCPAITSVASGWMTTFQQVIIVGWQRKQFTKYICRRHDNLQICTICRLFWKYATAQIFCK